MLRELVRTRGDLALCALLVGAVTLAYRPFFDSAMYVDDGMIALRVVDNILRGEGWTYNPGEPVNPCSSPLFAVALVVLGWIDRGVGALVPGVEGPLLGLEALPALAGVAALNALALVQYAAFRRDGRALAFALALVSAGGEVLRRSAGMETPLFLALALGACLSYARGRLIAAGVLAGLTALARPEGAALLVLLVGVDCLRRRRLDWRLSLSGAAVVAPWIAFSLLRFGSAIPHSVLVKTTAHIPVAEGTFFRIFFSQAEHPLLTLPLCLAGVAALILRGPQRTYALTVLGFCAIQVAAYGIGGAHPGYTWYLAPGNLAVDMAAVLGVFALGGAAAERAARALERGRGPSSKRTVVAAGFALVVVFALRSFGAAPVTPIRPYRLAADYTAAGRWIAEHAGTGDRVAAREIGYLGFHAQREIRDPYGLVHREALDALRAGDAHWWYLDRPEIVVTLADPPRAGDLPGLSPRQLADFETRYWRVHRAGDVRVWTLAKRKMPGP